MSLGQWVTPRSQTLVIVPTFAIQPSPTLWPISNTLWLVCSYTSPRKMKLLPHHSSAGCCVCLFQCSRVIIKAHDRFSKCCWAAKSCWFWCLFVFFFFKFSDFDLSQEESLSNHVIQQHEGAWSSSSSTRWWWVSSVNTCQLSSHLRVSAWAGDFSPHLSLLLSRMEHLLFLFICHPNEGCLVSPTLVLLFRAEDN